MQPDLARPLPLAWHITTRAILTVMVGYLGATLLMVAVTTQEYAFFAGTAPDAGSFDVAELASLADLERTASAVDSATGLAFLVGVIALWIAVTRAAARHGLPARGVWRHWSTTAWRVAAAASMILALGNVPPRITGTDVGTLRESALEVGRHQLFWLGA